MKAAPRARVQRRPVHGVILLDKPLKLSSNQALQKVRWLLRAEKGGHTGTLDPLATGVLPLCFGAATKFSQLHLDADKTYETVIRLGVQTDTGDAEGTVVAVQPVQCTERQVHEVLQRFTGTIEQLPPMHSALKKDGRALYHYAREGQTVEREARQVRIDAIELLDLQLQAPEPFLRLRVRCSKGTYIRTLGEDMGRALGCGGHLVALRRTRTGPFALDSCVTLEQLQTQPLDWLRPVECLVDGHVRVQLQASEAGRFLSGLRRRGDWADADRVAVFAPATQTAPPVFIGSGHVRAGELIPDRLLSPIEVEQILNPAMASEGP